MLFGLIAFVALVMLLYWACVGIWYAACEMARDAANEAASKALWISADYEVLEEREL